MINQDFVESFIYICLVSMNNEASSKIYEASYNFDFQSKNSPFLDEGVFFSCNLMVYLLHNLLLFKYLSETADR